MKTPKPNGWDKALLAWVEFEFIVLKQCGKEALLSEDLLYPSTNILMGSPRPLLLNSGASFDLFSTRAVMSIHCTLL